MDAFLLVVMLILALLLFIAVLLLALRARDAAAVDPAQVSSPGYRHDPKRADYYRPNSDTNLRKNAPTEGKPNRNDPRNVPLPKCPQCRAAVGFGEPKCLKCGYSLRTL